MDEFEKWLESNCEVANKYAVNDYLMGTADTYKAVLHKYRELKLTKESK